MLTAKEAFLLKQLNRRISVKIDILSKNNIVVGSFEGIAIDGNVTMDGKSVYRRSGNLKMAFKREYNILPSPSSKIWFGNKCSIKIGLKDYYDNMTWFNLGDFAMDEVELNINSAEKTLSCSLKDSMSFFDGTLGGKLSHKTVIEADSVTINEAIKTIIGSLTRYSMENIGFNGSTALVPYTIEKEPDSSIYELIKELLDLYMGFDFYFNEKGYLIVEKIKDRSTDPIIEYFDGQDKDFRLSTVTKMDFKNVRNSMYVWGRQLDTGEKIKWVYKNKYSRKTVTAMSAILDKEIGDICYVEENNTCYYWNSEWSALGFKVTPIFNIENIGEKIGVVSKDQLYTVEQAQLNAEYELLNYSNFAETVNFDCVPLYHLKPNHKIRLNIDDNINGDYLIDSVSIPLNISNPMSITCHKLYY